MGSNESSVETSIDRRRVLQSAGAFVAMASFAGCTADDSEGSPTAESPVGDGDTVDMGEFSVPQDNVVPESEIPKERGIQTIKLFQFPESTFADDWTVAQRFAEEASKLGLDFEVQAKNRNQQFQEVAGAVEPPDGNLEGWWDMSVWTFGPDPVRLDPDAIIYKHNHPDTQAGYNFNYFEDQRVTELVEAQRAATDRDERQTLMHEFQQVKSPIAGDIMYIWPDLVIPWNQERWDGFVNMKGIGPINPNSFANASPKTDRREMVAVLPGEEQIREFSPFTAGGQLPKVQMRIMYERLTWPNAEGLPEPRLATEVNFLDDTTIEVPIRQDAVFTDGRNVLAEDVKFSYDKNAEWESKFAGQIASIDNIEVADDHRVIFNTNQPFAPIEIVAFAQINIVQKTHWEEMMETDAFQNAERPDRFTPFDHDMEYVTNGPLKFDGMDKTREVRLTRFDDHWDPVDYDARLSRFVSSTNAAFNQLVEGTADTMIEFTGDPDVMSTLVEENDHLTSAKTPSVMPRWFTMNNDKPPFHIPKFRQALHHRMPKQEVIEGIFRGNGQTGHNTTISPSLDFWYDDSFGIEAFSLQTAANRLVEAGFVWDEEEGRLWLPEGKAKVPGSDLAPAERLGFDRSSVPSEDDE